MKSFYIALGVIALGGAALIGRQAMRRGGGSSGPSLTAALPPLAAGPRGVVEGSDSAPVEVTEFADFECPWCARFAVLNVPDIRSRLVATGRVRWRFVHFPLDGHRDSPSAHLAVACGTEQGKFQQMHDAVYNAQGEWVGARNVPRVLQSIAERAGLDRDRYRSCVAEQRAWGQVLADRALGDSLGVNSTPTFFINGRQFNERAGLSYDRLRQIVDSLAPVSAPPPASGSPRR